MLKLKNQTKNRNYLIKLFQYNPLKKQTISVLNKINEKKLKKIKTPKNLIFFVTNRCNAKCKHCFYWQSLNNNTDELSIKEIKQVILSLKNKIDTLLITGGEPLMRNDLYEIINLFNQINHTKKVHITTNGALTKKLFKLCEKILKTLDIELSAVFVSYKTPSKYNLQVVPVNVANNE